MEFTEEAKQKVATYVNHVRKKMRDTARDTNETQIEGFLKDVETEVNFLALRLSKTRNANIVEIQDVENALRKMRVELYRNNRIFSIFGKYILDDIDAIKREIGKSQEALVLDVGCGWGRATRNLGMDPRHVVETVGMDLDTFSLNYGRFLDCNVSFIKSDMKHMPFKSGIFDAVLSRKALHEVGSEQYTFNTLCEMSRVLKLNGLLYVFDPFIRWRVIKFVRRALHKISKIEEYSHTAEFENSMRNVGFTITRKNCIAWPTASASILCSYLAIKMDEIRAHKRLTYATDQPLLDAPQ